MQGLTRRGLTALLLVGMCGVSLGVVPGLPSEARAEPPARNLGADLVDAREIIEKVLTREEGESVERGSIVLLVEPDGPVDRAGLQTADAIVGLGGARVDATGDLLWLLGQRPIGARVPLTFVRDGQVMDTFIEVEGPSYGPPPQAWLGAPGPVLR
jgi:S1-C subfamily serine protease